MDDLRSTGVGTTIGADPVPFRHGGLADALTKAGVLIAVPLDELDATCTCRAGTGRCAHILATVDGLVLPVDERPWPALDLRGHQPPSFEGSERNRIELATLRAHEFDSVASG